MRSQSPSRPNENPEFTNIITPTPPERGIDEFADAAEKAIEIRSFGIAEQPTKSRLAGNGVRGAHACASSRRYAGGRHKGARQ